MFILLVIVCFNCYIELVKVLIDVEVDVNFQGKGGSYIFLFVVCGMGQMDIIYMLIEVGVDVNMINICYEKRFILLIYVC